MDEHGFRQAFHEHKNSVYAFAYRMTNSAAAAGDITQDCFLELFGRPERFVQPAVRSAIICSA